MLKTFFTLTITEMKLSIRDGNMPFFGILFPAAIMLLIGGITGASGASTNFSGIAMIGLCASALMGLPLTVSSYRHEKILKRFKVTPVSPAILLCAIAAVQSIVVWISATIVFLIARIVFGVTLSGNGLSFIGSFLFAQFSIFSIGFLIASLSPDMKKTNLICTVLYFPMLLLSGATIPWEVLPKGIRFVAEWFPITHAIQLVSNAASGIWPVEAATSIVYLALVAIIGYLLSAFTFRWE